MSYISDPEFAVRVRASFDRQNAMELIQATLPVAKAEVFAIKDGQESLCALMQQTIMVMHGRAKNRVGLP